VFIKWNLTKLRRLCKRSRILVIKRCTFIFTLTKRRLLLLRMKFSIKKSNRKIVYSINYYTIVFFNIYFVLRSPPYYYYYYSCDKSETCLNIIILLLCTRHCVFAARGEYINRTRWCPKPITVQYGNIPMTNWIRICSFRLSVDFEIIANLRPLLS
jgi:hypothetical protein